MCGIVGHISLNLVDKKQCELMSEAIIHRGPDDFGHYFEEQLFLGHRRLSIIDLTETGHQPMWDSEHKIGIIFNGEIYNYKEIKKELEEYDFKSSSDTEVIIYAYKKWGLQETLKKLNGMFSFALYDKENRVCYFTRDRIGIKPFVYYKDDKNFIFSSELKAVIQNKIVKKEINEKSLAEYFIHRYIPNPGTIFKNIFKLEPGHYIKLQVDTLKTEKVNYWSLDPKRYSSLNEEDIISKAGELIKESVKYRLIADTEVATFLSGGIDSSLISKFAKDLNPDIRAFTIDLKPEIYSESEYAEIAAKHSNTKLISKQVDKQSFQENFDKLISCYDEPFADSSLVPTYLLTKIVSESGIKCALSGDGGDEVFFGYKWYKTFNKLKQSEKFLTIFPEKIAKQISKFLKNDVLLHMFLSTFEQYRRIIFNRFTLKEINNLFGYKLDFKENNLFKKYSLNDRLQNKDLPYIDFNTFLPDDILYKVDIASMANSLEVRTPFLDHRLVELMFSVSFKYLYKKKSLKYILKEISKEHLPKENIYRKKKGFSAPVMEWISKDYKKELLAGELIKTGFISIENMKLFLEKESDKGKIWQLYIFERWYKQYMN